MVQSSSGLLAVFGPTSIAASSISQSLLAKHNIPHFQFVWRPTVNQENPAYMNFYPHPGLLAEGLATVIRNMNWKTFVILYEEDEGLLRLQEVLKLQNLKNLNDINTITVRQLSDADGNYRVLLKEIKNSTEGQILLDCRSENVLNILEQAKEVGLLEDLYNYFITSLVSYFYYIF